ncbi:MAG TPA: hypothetical protein VJ548_12515 [Azospira sp.]|nr:hypothetical protein [Azospira sp.]
MSKVFLASPPAPGRQQGAALLALFLVLFLLGAFGLMRQTGQGTWHRYQEEATTQAIAQAKEALISFATTYRDTHPDQVWGYLPCPDSNNDGVADPGNCGARDETVIGRLPWKTLGLPPLLDGTGECLWYVVSGNAKDSPKTALLNWDTPGLFVIKDSAGTLLAGASAHDRPWAALIAPGRVVRGQTRAVTGGSGGTACSGSLGASDYLEGLDSLSGPLPTLVLGTPESASNGSNNDRGLWLNGPEVFERIRQRSEFKNDIDTLLTDLSNCLNRLPAAALPPASPNNKGVGTFPPPLVSNEVLSLCLPTAPLKLNLLQNWQDNLLYATPASVNGDANCKAALLFAGARKTAATSPQIRETITQRKDPTNYLEGGNEAALRTGGNLAGPAYFDKSSPATDLLRCIKGLPVGAVHLSFASDFTNFAVTGGNQAAIPHPADATLELAGATGLTGGCFWYAAPLPLAGRTWRAYYEFQFGLADTSALGNGSDRGYGFTLQIVQGDNGTPLSCGSESKLGTLQPVDGWLYSLVVETDVSRNTGNADPAGNHTAIMINGNLNHAGSGSINQTCDGSASGCLHRPANQFEEAPHPLAHNQRVEIRTGCNSSCSSCTPANHAFPNNYANVAVWVDCRDCNDVAVALERAAQPPTIQRCVNLDSTMNTAYVGITSGFLSTTATAQSVVIQNFSLRSE